MLALLVMAAGPERAAAAGTDTRPPGGALSDSLVRELDIAGPSIVRIVTRYTVRVTLSVCGTQVTLPSGEPYSFSDSGTGAFISAHGDILTADHVVHVDRSDLNNSIFTFPDVAQDAADAINQACGSTLLISAADVENGFIQASGINFSTSTSTPATTVYRSTEYTGAYAEKGDSDEPLRGVPGYTATVTESSSFAQDDVALVHVPLDDTPSIALEPTAFVAADDRLAIIGFPGNGDLNNDPTNLLTPSVNTIYVSAIKQNDNGSPLIQVGGNVEHGDSGGPALDVDGHIVGVVSFSFVNGDEPGSTAFLRASDSALKLVQADNLDTTPGTFENLWRQAFTDYAATYEGHWHKAAQELDALSQKYPDFKAIAPYQEYADSAAATETVGLVGGQSTVTIAAVGGGAVLLIAIVAIVAVVLVRRRRQNAQAAAIPAMAYMPQVPQPYSSYYGYGYPPGWSQPAQPAQPAQQPQPAQSAPQQSGGYPASGYPQPSQAPQAPQAPQPVQVPTASGGASYSPYGSYSSGSATPTAEAQQPGNAPAAGTSTPQGSDRYSAPSDPVGGAYCVNGHPMAAGATRCPICGGAPYASNVPVRQTDEPQRGW